MKKILFLVVIHTTLFFGLTASAQKIPVQSDCDDAVPEDVKKAFAATAGEFRAEITLGAYTKGIAFVHVCPITKDRNGQYINPVGAWIKLDDGNIIYKMFEYGAGVDAEKMFLKGQYANGDWKQNSSGVFIKTYKRLMPIHVSQETFYSGNGDIDDPANWTVQWYVLPPRDATNTYFRY